jgi:hypothetical protein
MSALRPPTVRRPWETIFTSRAKRTRATTMRSTPRAEMGRMEAETANRTRETTPTTPGRIAPGVENSR